MVIIYTPVSVQRVMGKLACVLGDWNLAFDHFEHACITLSHGKADFEYAQTLLDYAFARERRHRRGDYAKAEALNKEASVVLGRLELPFQRSGDAAGAGAAVPAVSHFALSEREVEILRLISEGTRNPKIAESLGISRHTVDRHLENIFNKMQVHSRTQAVVAATAAGLLV
jgi:DNA-binding CsgD family transcriptional regulator